MRGYGRCVKHMRGQLGECGVRITAAREVILSVLGKIAEHASAEDVYLAAHKLYPRIGLTTVYRTLELLYRMGIIHKIEFGDGRARYELADAAGGKDHHHHLVCTQCGRIINYDDFSAQEIKVVCGMQQELEKKHRFRIKQHSVQYYGLCEKCEGHKER